MQQVRSCLQNEAKRTAVACRFLGLNTSGLNSNGYSYVTDPNNRDKDIEIDDMKWLLRGVAVGLGSGVCGKRRKYSQSRQTNGTHQQTSAAKYYSSCIEGQD